jgi:DHA1 family inner membrane transport protein
MQATDYRNPSAQSRPSMPTSWLTVLLAISAGALAAFQVGKVHIALPSIRQSFSLGLLSASWILSALNVVGLFAATPTGTICARMGNKRAVVTGLVMVALASACGGFSPSLAWLLVSRLVEGVGFVMIVVAAPSLIVEVANPDDLRLSLAGWSAYMPGGVAIVTVLAPLVLTHHTWRAVWWLDATLLVLAALVIGFFAKKGISKSKFGSLRPWEEFSCVVEARGPALLAVIFGMYTMQHLSVMGFMPTLLHDRFNLTATRIGILLAIAMASNIIGNLAAGMLLQRGFSRAAIIGWASAFMALMTVGIFLLPLPLPAFYLCAVAFSCVGGLVPSSVMGAAPFHTPSPSLLGATNGLLVQGSSLGIVAGPPLMSFIATRLGWHWVPLMTGVSAVVAAALARNMRSSAHSNPDYFAEEPAR